jgi:hypothetical protein
LANNDELFIKNHKRFKLEKSSILNKSLLNEENYTLLLQKYYDLIISPVEVVDSGWYSCYIVKRLWYEQNIKVFMF